MLVRQVVHEGHADLLELVFAGDLDGVLDADLLAELAGDAVLVDDRRDLAGLRKRVAAAVFAMSLLDPEPVVSDRARR